MKKERLIYLDIIRIFAFMCIIIIHFNASVSGYDIFGKFVYPNHIIPNYYVGCYLGDIGVGLFFILTGACLQLVYGEIEFSKQSLIHFYKKRWLSLFPMYYITFFIFTLFSFVWNKGYPDINEWHLICSLLGIDGYCMALRQVGYETYQCGEWFLGCIICIYLIYPIISKVTNKFPIATFLISITSYFLFLKMGLNDRWFFIEIPYILMGIYFIKYFNTVITSRKLWIFTFILIFIRIFAGNSLHSHTICLITCWTLFLLIILAYKVINKFSTILKSEKALKLIPYIGILTYPLFLVHHKVINILAQMYDLTNFPYRYTLLLFCVYILITTWLSISIYKLSNKLVEANKKQKSV